MFDPWCNGNTADFGSVISGSSPDGSTKKEVHVPPFLFDLDYGLGVLSALSLFCKKYVFCKAADHLDPFNRNSTAAYRKFSPFPLFCTYSSFPVAQPSHSDLFLRNASEYALHIISPNHKTTCTLTLGSHSTHKIKRGPPPNGVSLFYCSLRYNLTKRGIQSFRRVSRTRYL